MNLQLDQNILNRQKRAFRSPVSLALSLVGSIGNNNTESSDSGGNVMANV